MKNPAKNSPDFSFTFGCGIFRYAQNEQSFLILYIPPGVREYLSRVTDYIEFLFFLQVKFCIISCTCMKCNVHAAKNIKFIILHSSF